SVAPKIEAQSLMTVNSFLGFPVLCHAISEMQCKMGKCKKSKKRKKCKKRIAAQIDSVSVALPGRFLPRKLTARTRYHDRMSRHRLGLSQSETASSRDSRLAPVAGSAGQRRTRNLIRSRPGGRELGLPHVHFSFHRWRPIVGAAGSFT